MHRTHISAALVVAFTLLVPTLSGASDLWLHVRVDERDDDARVVINLPLGLIDKALPMIDVGGHLRDDSLRLNGRRFSYHELRDLWLEVRDGPDMAFVSVEERDETVKLWKEGDYFHVRAQDRHDGRVDVRMPLAVVDALLATEGSFDLPAALAALAERGEGELVRVEEEDESVRVWVDRLPESEPTP